MSTRANSVKTHVPLIVGLATCSLWSCSPVSGKSEPPPSAGMVSGGSGGTSSSGGTISSGGTLASGGLASGAVGAGTGGTDAIPRGKRPGSVFVHLFEWPWPDIAAECEQVLGPAGYTAVQVSPPNEHAILGNQPWWQRYQPVSYAIESRSGTREEFVDMVERCGAVGVDIYVDAVINHMTAQDSGVGSNGLEFTKYEYPGVWTASDFHSPACSIEGIDYTTDADRVRGCELLGLSDLKTEAPSVRTGIAQHLLSLVDIGVRGFRIDAAKHMLPEDVGAIIAEVAAESGDAAPYFFLEVIDGGGEATSVTDYVPLEANAGAEIDITEFKYLGVGERFLGEGTWDDLLAAGESGWGLLPSDRAVVFTDNHDTQRNGSIHYRDGLAHQLSNVFVLGFPYGYPKIMSSYAFAEGAGRDQGPPSDEAHVTQGPHGGVANCFIPVDPAAFVGPADASTAPGTWACEHRDPVLRSMVRFRAVTAGAPLSNGWVGAPGQVAFAREARGFLAINATDETLSTSFVTSLPGGSYCNVLERTAACTEAAIMVDAAGSAMMTIPPQRAVALHVEALAP